MRNKKRILWILIVAVTMLGVIFGEGTPLTYVYGGDTEAYYLNFPVDIWRQFISAYDSSFTNYFAHFFCFLAHIYGRSIV